MKRDSRRIQGEKFDLIVVGGGIIGTGIARDAALRGLILAFGPAVYAGLPEIGPAKQEVSRAM